MKIKKLTKTDKTVLRKLVKWKCEGCGEYEEGNELQAFTKGDDYNLRDIKMLCRECIRIQ